MPYYEANNVTTHIHHIVPKHMTGGVANNHPDNLIELTVAAHADAHYQLWLKNGLEADKIAWQFLSGQINLTEAIRAAQRMPERIEKIRRSLIGNKRTLGYRHTEETRAKMRAIQLLAQNTTDVKAKKSASLKGIRRTPEWRNKLSIAQKGIACPQRSWGNGIKATCVQCHQELGVRGLHTHIAMRHK